MRRKLFGLASLILATVAGCAQQKQNLPYFTEPQSVTNQTAIKPQNTIEPQNFTDQNSEEREINEIKPHIIIQERITRELILATKASKPSYLAAGMSESAFDQMVTTLTCYEGKERVVKYEATFYKNDPYANTQKFTDCFGSEDAGYECTVYEDFGGDRCNVSPDYLSDPTVDKIRYRPNVLESEIHTFTGDESLEFNDIFIFDILRRHQEAQKLDECNRT